VAAKVELAREAPVEKLYHILSIRARKRVYLPTEVVEKTVETPGLNVDSAAMETPGLNVVSAANVVVEEVPEGAKFWLADIIKLLTMLEEVE
jgi:hypothetical protein